MSTEPKATEEDEGDDTGIQEGRDATEATPGAVGVEAAPGMEELPDDQQELREQIEETRSDLGDTVDALSAKADVKAQVKDQVDERKAQLRDQQARAQAKLNDLSGQAKDNPTPFAAAAGGLVALLVLIGFWRRRR